MGKFWWKLIIIVLTDQIFNKWCNHCVCGEIIIIFISINSVYNSQHTSLYFQTNLWWALRQHLWPIVHHTSYIIHHTSYIMHHTSYIIHHTSYIHTYIHTKYTQTKRETSHHIHTHVNAHTQRICTEIDVWDIDGQKTNNPQLNANKLRHTHVPTFQTHTHT